MGTPGMRGTVPIWPEATACVQALEVRGGHAT